MFRASCSEFQMLVNSTCTCSLDCSIVSLNKLDKKMEWGEFPVIHLYFRYLESCSIPVLKRKCKSSTNTSSSSSDDDKKTQQTQQEFKALEGNARDTDNHHGNAMIYF